MRKFLIALALMSYAATTVQAHGGRWHGHGHGHHHSAGPFLFFGALAALSVPLLYAQRTQPEPVHHYDGAAPSRIYVPTTQRGHVMAATPSAGSSEVIEWGPVGSLPPMNLGHLTEERSAGNAQYPVVSARSGQNPQQFAQDRHDCSRWATHESGYDPDLRKHRNPETGPAAYGRALDACLERRGYAVR